MRSPQKQEPQAGSAADESPNKKGGGGRSAMNRDRASPIWRRSPSRLTAAAAAAADGAAAAGAAAAAAAPAADGPGPPTDPTGTGAGGTSPPRAAKRLDYERSPPSSSSNNNDSSFSSSSSSSSDSDEETERIKTKRRKASAALAQEEDKLRQASRARLEEERRYSIASTKKIQRIEEERKLKVAESTRLREERKAAESMRKAEELMKIAEELQRFEEDRAARIVDERQRLEAELAASAKALAESGAAEVEARVRREEAEEERRRAERETEAALAVVSARRSEAEARLVKVQDEIERKVREADEKAAAAAVGAEELRDVEAGLERKGRLAEETNRRYEEESRLCEERRRAAVREEGRRVESEARTAEAERRRGEAEAGAAAARAAAADVRSEAEARLAAVEAEIERKRWEADLNVSVESETAAAVAAKARQLQEMEAEAEEKRIEAEEERRALEERRTAAAEELKAEEDRRAEAEGRASEAERRRLEKEQELEAAVAAADARLSEAGARLAQVEAEIGRKGREDAERRGAEEEAAAALAARARQLRDVEAGLERKKREAEEECQRLDEKRSGTAKVLAAEVLAVELRKRETEEEHRMLEEKRQAAAGALALEEARRVQVEERMMGAERRRREAEEKMAAAVAAANAARSEAEARLAAVEAVIERKRRVADEDGAAEMETAAAAATQAKQLQGIDIDIESTAEVKKIETEQRRRKAAEEEIAAAVAAAHATRLEAEARLAAVEVEIERKRRAADESRRTLEMETAAAVAAKAKRLQEMELAAELKKREAEEEHRIYEERRAAAAREEAKRVEAEQRMSVTEQRRREAEEGMAAAVAAANAARSDAEARLVAVEAEIERKRRVADEERAGELEAAAVAATNVEQLQSEQKVSANSKGGYDDDESDLSKDTTTRDVDLSGSSSKTEESRSEMERESFVEIEGGKDVIAQVQASQEYYRNRALFGPDEDDSMSDDDMSGLTSASPAPLDPSPGATERNGTQAACVATMAAGLLQQQPSTSPPAFCPDNAPPPIAAISPPEQQRAAADNPVSTSASKLLLQIHERRHRALRESGNEDAANLYARAVRKESRARVADNGAGDSPEFGPTLAAAAAVSTSFQNESDSNATSDSEASPEIEYDASAADEDKLLSWMMEEEDEDSRSGSAADVTRERSSLARATDGDNKKSNQVIKAEPLEQIAGDGGKADERNLDEVRDMENVGKSDGEEPTPSFLWALEYSSFGPSSLRSSSSSVTFSSGEMALTPIKAAEEEPELATRMIPVGVYLTQPVISENEAPFAKDETFASPDPADLTSSTASPSPCTEVLDISSSLDDSNGETTVERLLRECSPSTTPHSTPTVALSRKQGYEPTVDEEGTDTETETQSADDLSLHQRLCEADTYSPSVKRAEPFSVDSHKSAMAEKNDDVEVVEAVVPVSRDLSVPFGAAAEAELEEEGIGPSGHTVDGEGGEDDDVEKGEGKSPEETVSNRRRCRYAKALLAIAVVGVAGVGIYLGITFLGPGNESPSVSASPADFSETSISMTTAPTVNPTATPTLEPTPLATVRPIVAPTPLATVRPIVAPTLRPTVAVTTTTTAPPTQKPTLRPRAFAGHDTFSFYVMGDGPYSEEEEETLEEQLKQLSVDEGPEYDDDGAVFILHLGDILRRDEAYVVDDDLVVSAGDAITCKQKKYERAKNILLENSPLPALVLPGDDDWLVCPNTKLAWERWEESFINLEQNWVSSAIPATVERDDGRIENFAFARSGVLFIGVNVIRADDGLPREKLNEVEEILNDSALWVEDQLDKYDFDDGDIRAVVIFGHAYWRDFFEGLRDVLEATNVPILYIHGNGQTYEVQTDDNNDDDNDDDYDWEVPWVNFSSIQVDQLGIAPPIKVSVQGTTDRANQMSWAESSDHEMIYEFIRLDRRGGTTNGPLAYTRTTTKELTFVGTCEDIDRGCGRCEGGCDDDSGCQPGLKCFQRDGSESVPGCSGAGVDGYDYCHSPEEDVI